MTHSSNRRPTAVDGRIVLVMGLLSLGAVCSARGDLLRVPEDYGTIQGAIDRSEPGDTIVVGAGTYRENIVVSSDIDVRGASTQDTRLAPDDGDFATITVTDAVGVNLSHFTMIDAVTAISVAGSAGIEIAHVAFAGAAGAAVAVDGLSDVDVTHNVFYDNEIGLQRGSAAVQIEGNIFEANGTDIANTALDSLGATANVSANCFERDPFDLGGVLDGGLLPGGVGTLGDPRFVDPSRYDFRLREGSACIDAARGTDAIDRSIADAGVYGGADADLFPGSVAGVTLADTSTAEPPSANIEVSWEPNLDYRVTNSQLPGSYLVYYKRGGEAAPPFDGADAGGGTQPSPIGVAADPTRFVLPNLAPQTVQPLTPRLVDASPRSESTLLSWEPAQNATSYTVHYGVGSIAENALDVGNVTSHTVTGLQNGTSYRFAVSASNQPIYHVAVAALDNTPARNESPLSPVASIALGSGSASEPSTELVATPGPIEPVPDLPDEDGCFIATVAYGGQATPQVEVLRDFRDRFLLTHAPGRWLVRQYYRHGPRAAAFVERHEALKAVVRAGLAPLVLAALLLVANAPLTVLTLAAAGAFAAHKRLARPAPRLASAALAAAAAVLACKSAHSEESAPNFSPRWMYEIKGGYFEPDLDDFEQSFGDNRAKHWALAGGYRLRDWLEVGVEIGHLRERGDGRAPDGSLVDAVHLRLVPLQAFVTYVHQPDETRRFVPYAGGGLAVTWYEEDVALQSTRDGRSDVGAGLRLGVRWLFDRQGPRPPEYRRGTSIYSRSYLFLEAQRIDTEIDDIDLGGITYQLGFRAELELGR